MKVKIKNTYLLNTALNYIFRVVNMFISYITIPLTLGYLDNERYGVWQTILAIISWASLSNFGIGNGLRNKVTESLEKKNYKKLRSYITSAYVYLTVISIIILILAISIIMLVDTKTLFKGTTLNKVEIIASFIIVIVSFCINFILGLSNSIAFGIHKSSLVNFFQVISNILTLIGIVLINKFSEVSLINIALIYLIANTFSNIIFTLLIWKNKKLRPSSKFLNKAYGKELTSIGIEFFILQCASIILFSTDNFMISTFIDVNKVADYSLVSKIFQVVSTLFSILLVQLWSEVASAMVKDEYEWIKKAVKRLIILLLPTGLMLFIMVLLFNTIMKFWIGRELEVDKVLIYLSAFYAFCICFNGIFVNVQNGMGKIRVQTISSILSCVINIPLAYILIKVFNLGINGVMISNIICLLISSIMCSIDVYYKLANRKSEKY